MTSQVAGAPGLGGAGLEERVVPAGGAHASLGLGSGSVPQMCPSSSSVSASGASGTAHLPTGSLVPAAVTIGDCPPGLPAPPAQARGQHAGQSEACSPENSFQEGQSVEGGLDARVINPSIRCFKTQGNSEDPEVGGQS